MPFIHIKSLPFKKDINLENVITGISIDFARNTGINIEHVSVTWEFFRSSHYVHAGKTAVDQPQDSHPVLVDFLSPDFNSTEKIGKMLSTIANSISQRIGVPLVNIFINHRQAHSGMVFDDGEIVGW